MPESSSPAGYAGKFLRVNLSSGTLTEEQWEAAALRKWVGGSSVGAKVLYDEVEAAVQWSDPENRLIMATGPLAGTSLMGGGNVSFVTKGPMTGGAATTQANGFMGAYMKFAGFDAVIVQGRSEKWVYLYLHDGVAELMDAEHLLGLDTYEVQEKITQELGKQKRQLSVLGVGPAGERQVRFAAIAGDRGHVAGHNGSGAVMGSKHLKAIAAERGKSRFPIADEGLLRERAKEIRAGILATPAWRTTYEWGSSHSYPSGVRLGYLPVRNLTTSLFDAAENFAGWNYRLAFKARPSPCWSCSARHAHRLTVPDGRYAGYEGEEPEYEQLAAMGSIIGNTDFAAAVVLSNEVDRLGLENNETGWLIGWAMECYERGILTREDTGGLELTWGNVEAVRELLRKIAYREGIGNLLAEGVKRASEKVGRGSERLGVYTMKGNTVRGHDHRARWVEMVDTCVSDTGTIEVGPACKPEEQGAKANPDGFSWQDVAEQLGKHNGRMMFEDSVGLCRWMARTTMAHLGKTVEAATGWQGFTGEEAMTVGRRVSNLLRLFNLRCGLTPDLEMPSARYGSVPVDGPAAGTNVMEQWNDMRRVYYELMGWDLETGRPWPETLSALGLGDLVPQVWPHS